VVTLEAQVEQKLAEYGVLIFIWGLNLKDSVARSQRAISSVKGIFRALTMQNDED
jgi:hypothetical protein